jgi:hypothetical protein
MAYIDIESLSLDGNSQIVILPEPKERAYQFFKDRPDGVSFECPFDHTDKNVKRFFNALMLPERKFVRWRKKKMLVSKTRQRLTTMDVRFDLPHVLKQLGL